jgi:hypothetical protein
VQVRDLEPSEIVIPSHPEDGLVLRVHARFLSRDDAGRHRPARTEDFPLLPRDPDTVRAWQSFLEPNTEYMWLTQDEWQALVPADPTPGQQIEVDSAVVRRMARFHLTPQRATTSEGHIVDRRSVKTAQMVLEVGNVLPAEIHMALSGRVHWGSDFVASQATSPNGPLPQGYETPLHGRLIYDRRKHRFTRFDIVAPGEVWGRWGDANGKSMYVERPGRAPFGFALELATGESPTDRIPPGGNGRYVSEAAGYFTRADER